jgi:hypothetical protein
MALGGFFKCGCSYTCIRSLVLTSTTGIFLHPTIVKGKFRLLKVASTISIDHNISQLFELFFKGFTNPLWLPYLNNDNFTLPYEFKFKN